jgi:hypothetical protein
MIPPSSDLRLSKSALDSYRISPRPMSDSSFSNCSYLMLALFLAYFTNNSLLLDYSSSLSSTSIFDEISFINEWVWACSGRPNSLSISGLFCFKQNQQHILFISNICWFCLKQKSPLIDNELGRPEHAHTHSFIKDISSNMEVDESEEE